MRWPRPHTLCSAQPGASGTSAEQLEAETRGRARRRGERESTTGAARGPWFTVRGPWFTVRLVSRPIMATVACGHFSGSSRIAL
eukprot:scaffold12231_cov103-Isochrysis_galbana.AAC.1